MTTTTPYLGLVLYDSSGDQAATFATFRAVLAGTASTSNFYKIDTAMSAFNVRITALENNAGAISVPMTYISANYYEASGISGITAYNTGATIIVNLDTTSAGTVTLNINSLGTKSLMKIDSTGSPVNIAGTELKKNVRYLFVYDGTRWLWVSQKEKDDGWIDEGSTWTYSSADASTGIASANADMTTTLQKGTKFGYTQSQALSGYWTFNTDNSASVGSFTMANIATPTYTAGKFSNALTLNGTTQALSITDTATLKPTGEYTVGCWFKTSNTGADKTVFQSWSANTAFAGILVQVSSANVIRCLHGKNTGTVSGIDYVTITGTTTVTDGNWHYLVVSYRNNYIQLYLDNKLEASGYTLTPAYAGTNYIRIGCGNNTGSDISWYNGQVDDLFFINGYALDEKTIYDKYVADSAQGTSSLNISKNAFVTNVGVYSGGNTLITFWGGTDFSLANATISNPKYSNEKTPFGFNINPEKWKVVYENITQVNTGAVVSAATITNFTGHQLDVPIGLWNLGFDAYGIITHAGVANLSQNIGLSTANNTFSDPQLVATGTNISASLTEMDSYMLKRKYIYLPAKVTYYLNSRGSQANTTQYVRGTTQTTTISAYSAYI